jgi:cell division protein FtsB
VRPSRGGATREAPGLLSRVTSAIVPGLILVAAYYALFGGEYSLLELRAARDAVLVERSELALLEQQIDSLAAWSDSLRNDPVTLERIAREQFGMIRDGETLYRFAAPVAADGEPREPDQP